MVAVLEFQVLRKKFSGDWLSFILCERKITRVCTGAYIGLLMGCTQNSLKKAWREEFIRPGADDWCIKGPHHLDVKVI